MRLVTVVIPARDAETYLARAINSALEQTYPAIEIIVDDASCDRTYQVARKYGGCVHVLRTERPLGPGAARNLGVKAARGEYVAFLDADDEWLPEKTEKQLHLIETDPEMTFVWCRFEVVSRGAGEAGRPIEDYASASGRNAWKVLLARPLISTPTVLARCEAVSRVGLFDPLLRTAEDQDLWIKLARLGPIGHLDEVLVRVHDTPDSLTKSYPREGILNTIAVVGRHLRLATRELTPKEVNEVWAERFERLGRNAYEAGEVALGMQLLFRSVRLGRPTLPVLTYIAAASRLARIVKRKLGPFPVKSDGWKARRHGANKS